MTLLLDFLRRQSKRFKSWQFCLKRGESWPFNHQWSTYHFHLWQRCFSPPNHTHRTSNSATIGPKPRLCKKPRFNEGTASHHDRIHTMKGTSWYFPLKKITTSSQPKNGFTFSRTLVNLTHKFKSEKTMAQCCSTSSQFIASPHPEGRFPTGWVFMQQPMGSSAMAYEGSTALPSAAAPQCPQKETTYSGPALSRDGLKLQSLNDLKHQPPKCISANICQYLQYVFYIYLSPISGCMSKIFCPRCSLM